MICVCCLVGGLRLKDMQKSIKLTSSRVFIDCVYVIRIGEFYWDGAVLVSSVGSAVFFTNYALATSEARRIPKAFKRPSGCQVHRLGFPKTIIG